MPITLKDTKRDNRQLVTKDMLKSEYFIAEKLYDAPLTGSGTNAEGSFEWVLYTLAVHEIKTFDEDAGEMKTQKFDTPEQVSYFKGAKTFREDFDVLPVNTKVKVRQEPIEGKAYKTFVIEEVGTGDTKPDLPDGNADLTMPEFVKKMKTNGMLVGDVVKQTLKIYPEQSEDVVKSVYEAI